MVPTKLDSDSTSTEIYRRYVRFSYEIVKIWCHRLKLFFYLGRPLVVSERSLSITYSVLVQNLPLSLRKGPQCSSKDSPRYDVAVDLKRTWHLGNDLGPCLESEREKEFESNDPPLEYLKKKTKKRGNRIRNRNLSTRSNLDDIVLLQSFFL